MKKIKSAIGWLCFYIMLFLSITWAWDYVINDISGQFEDLRK